MSFTYIDPMVIEDVQAQDAYTQGYIARALLVADGVLDRIAAYKYANPAATPTEVIIAILPTVPEDLQQVFSSLEMYDMLSDAEACRLSRWAGSDLDILIQKILASSGKRIGETYTSVMSDVSPQSSVDSWVNIPGCSLEFVCSGDSDVLQLSCTLNLVRVSGNPLVGLNFDHNIAHSENEWGYVAIRLNSANKRVFIPFKSLPFTPEVGETYIIAPQWRVQDGVAGVVTATTSNFMALTKIGE